MASRTEFHYIRIPHAYMRDSSDPTSTIVSDALFGERVEHLEKQSYYMKIRTVADKYIGWVPRDAVATREKPFFNVQDTWEVSSVRAHVYAIRDTEKGPILTLSFGARVKVLDSSGERWIKILLVDGREAFIQKGNIAESIKNLDISAMLKLSKQFLGTPYAWGGRGFDGFDCSGFVQMLYTKMGVQLPRDSKDQFSFEGFDKVELEKNQPGDLIFFGIDEKIRHVGLSLGGGEFIHATVRDNKPWVQISSLTEEPWCGSDTLPFRAARRLINAELQKTKTENSAKTYVMMVGLSAAIGMITSLVVGSLRRQ
jgi:gamma-D-glutamyl-L-lysine dipeptidyl-peptidase